MAVLLFALPLLALAAGAAEPLRRPIDAFDDITTWRVNDDGSKGVTFRAEADLVVSPPSALRVVFTPPGAGVWGNLRRAVSVPPDASALRFRLRVLAAEPEAAMHIWFMEADGDGWVTRVGFEGGRRLAELERDAWHTVTVPLGLLNHQPRGDGKRAFLTTDTMLLGHNFAPLEIVVDDLEWVLTGSGGGAPLPATPPGLRPADGPRGRVALLDEPGLPRGEGAPGAEAVGAVLACAGYGVTGLRAGDIANPDTLSPEVYDLLLLPNGPAFPAAAHEALLAYLKSGGAVLTLGGYAFDRPMAWTGEAWVEAGTELRASDLDRGIAGAPINSRLGKPGDTMGLRADQIGLFDPSDMFEQVAYSEWGGKRVDGPIEGFVARSLAGSNSPVFPAQHGETETLGKAYDRLGRPRGALAVVAHFFDGPFKGGAWGGLGVTNRDLLADDAFGEGLLLELVARLVDGVFVHSLSAEPVCVRGDEPVTVTLKVAHRGRRPGGGTVRVMVDGEPVLEREVAPAPGGEETLRVEVKPGEADLQRVAATLTAAGREPMEVETGFCVWSPDIVSEGPSVEWRDNRLWVAGSPRFRTGTNQTGVMWFSPREHPLTWDRDFAQMAEHGHRIWRVLHFSPHTVGGVNASRENPLLLAEAPPERLVRQTDAMVQLAQKHGLVFMPCAHDWIDVALPEDQLEAQRTWNRFWAARYRDVPGIVWDIQNEPSVRWNEDNPPPHILSLWERFLTEEYGSLAAAREAWGLAADAPLPPKTGGEWGDARAAAAERFRTWLLDRWVRVNVEGLRAGDADAIITVGYLQSRQPADKVNGAARLDFSNMHSYNPPREFLASLRFIDRRAYGRGLSLGEFGSRNSHDHRTHGQTGDRRELDRPRFATTLAQTFGVGGAFALNWCWRDLPDVVFPWGLFRHDRVARPWVADFDAWSAALGGVEPVHEPPALYVLLPDRHRLGPEFATIDAALQRTFDTLEGLHVPYAVLNEFALDAIPDSARAILWPLPYCPTDAAFSTVRDWVARGGRLYASGGLGYDAERRPTRGERYAALGLPEQPATPPRADAVSGREALTGRVDAGRVMFVPEPAELGDPAVLRQTYRRFLEWAGVPRLPVTPDTSEVWVSIVPGTDGERMITAVSWGEAREVTLGGEPEVRLTLAADHAGLVHLGADGRVLGVLAQGPVTVDGEAVASGEHYLVRSLDGRDVRDAGELAITPLAPGTVTVGERSLTADAALVGETVTLQR